MNTPFLAVKNLSIGAFRSYDQPHIWNELDTNFVIITGQNGAGKTNLLEAVSLLSPVRGLRGAPLIDLQSIQNTDHGWYVSAELQDDQLGVGYDLALNKKQLRINGDPVTSHNQFLDYCSCIWLTPQMDRLFQDSASHRRRFWDRMIHILDKTHGSSLNRFEKLMAQRNKLLKEPKLDSLWLDSLEHQIAAEGVVIAANRLQFMTQIQICIDQSLNEAFPKATLSLQGQVEQWLRHHTALETEQYYKNALKQNRQKDAQSGGAQTGVHRTDLHVVYSKKSMAAAQCSTGEQKALLISLFLAHAHLIHLKNGYAPIVLLDEIPAHLDENRRAALYHILHAMNAQIWMTGTEASLFEPLPKSVNARFVLL